MYFGRCPFLIDYIFVRSEFDVKAKWNESKCERQCACTCVCVCNITGREQINSNSNKSTITTTIAADLLHSDTVHQMYRQTNEPYKAANQTSHSYWMCCSDRNKFGWARWTGFMCTDERPQKWHQIFFFGNGNPVLSISYIAGTSGEFCSELKNGKGVNRVALQ